MSKKVRVMNRLEVAKKQMEKFIDKIKLPENVVDGEQDYYHVALVDSVPNPKTLEFVHKLKIVKYNTKSWEAVKNRLVEIGHGKAYILHDPTIKSIEDMSWEELKVEAEGLGFDGDLSKTKKDDLVSFIKSK